MSETTPVLPEPHPGTGRRGARGLVAVVASVIAVVLVAVGGFAAWQFFSAGGPQPAEVLPDSTFALVTVDLDPSGGQKIEAMQTLRKFPSWKKRIGVNADDDLVKEFVERGLKDSPCKSLDYEQDVQPWIGSRAGFGGVLLGDDKPAPVLVLQVKDAEKAETGFAELTKCTEVTDDDFGWTISGDYIVGSDSTSHAEAIASAGKESPLASDADFQKWTEEAGGPGIMNAYFGRKGVKVLADEFAPDFGGGMSPRYLDKPDEGAGKQATKALKDFKGAAAGLRFANEGIELSIAGGGVQQAGDGKVADHVSALPADTAAVLALAVPEDALRNLGGAKGSPFAPMEMLGAFTGLDLPQDLIDLLGSSLSVSLGADAPADLNGISGPEDVPIGALVHGDEEKAQKVLDKIMARIGVQGSKLPVTVSTGEGKAAIATTSAYADQLLEDGSLGKSKNFEDVVENADDAQAVVYVSFENDWVDVVRKTAAQEDDADAKEVADNLAVLRALGASAWSEGDTGHARVRLALK